MHPVIVLDFDTTGMSGDLGARSTEVAAVRVENGQILDRFQSLINSSRLQNTGRRNSCWSTVTSTGYPLPHPPKGLRPPELWKNTQ